MTASYETKRTLNPSKIIRKLNPRNPIHKASQLRLHGNSASTTKLYTDFMSSCEPTYRDSSRQKAVLKKIHPHKTLGLVSSQQEPIRSRHYFIPLKAVVRTVASHNRAHRNP